jgi:hypothetical protein
LISTSPKSVSGFCLAFISIRFLGFAMMQNLNPPSATKERQKVFSGAELRGKFQYSDAAKQHILSRRDNADRSLG